MSRQVKERLENCFSTLDKIQVELYEDLIEQRVYENCMKFVNDIRSDLEQIQKDYVIFGEQGTQTSSDKMQTVKIIEQSMPQLDEYLEKFWFDSTGFWWSTILTPQDFPKRQVDLFIAEVSRIYDTCDMENSIIVQVFNSDNQIIETRTFQGSDE